MDKASLEAGESTIASPNSTNGQRAPRPLVLLVMLAAFSLPLPVVHANPSDLEDLSLEELINLKVTTASRRSQRAGDVAAAIFVITQDDIRRSGARSIPEALRLAPGLQVAQLDASRWAISARGFNGRFANKLLVLMDGRTLYTQSFSGVYWDAHETVVEDIERIEVIRGAAGTIWGTNAVNGIINIITKRAAQTGGFLMSADQAMDGSGTVSLRYGAADRSDFQWRVYGKLQTRDNNELINGEAAADEADQKRLGARAEWQLNDRDAAHMVIEGYEGSSGFTAQETFLPANFIEGAEALDGVWTSAGWSRALGDESRFELQTYFDHFDRNSLIYGERRDTIDVDMQFVSPRLGSHVLTAGLNTRYTNSRFDTQALVRLSTAGGEAWLGSLYLQDEVGFLQERLRLTAGTRVEQAQDEPVSVLPNLRLQFAMTPDFMTWAAIARGERRPGGAERDIELHSTVPTPPNSGLNVLPVPLFFDNTRNRDFKSEKLLSSELGARWQIHEMVSFDVALFQNRYRRLRGANILAVVCEPSGIDIRNDPSCLLTADSVRTLSQLDNSGRGTIHGGEVLVRIAPTSAWRLTAQYTRLDKNLEFSDVFAFNASVLSGSDPRNQYGLRSTLSLSPQWDWDLSLRSVDSISGQPIPGYTELGTRLSWQPNNAWEISLVGNNLLNRSHLEAVSELTDLQPVLIERAVMLQARWSWR